MKELEVLLNKRCTWRTAEIHYREDGMSDH